jgi:hypothetical protein
LFSDLYVWDVAFGYQLGSHQVCKDPGVNPVVLDLDFCHYPGLVWIGQCYLEALLVEMVVDPGPEVAC